MDQSIVPVAASDKDVETCNGEARHSASLVTPFVKAAKLNPLPGDLIEFDRGAYRHWGLFVGDGKVVHVRGGIADSEVSATGTANVNMDLLEFVAGESLVRINNQEAHAERLGVAPLPLDDLMEAAKSLVGSQVPYDLWSKNCEHYVTEWRYGQPGWSAQMDTVKQRFSDVSDAARPMIMAKLEQFLRGRGPPP